MIASVVFFIFLHSLFLVTITIILIMIIIIAKWNKDKDISVRCDKVVIMLSWICLV